jgi:hypothetical protein
MPIAPAQIATWLTLPDLIAWLLRHRSVMHTSVAAPGRADQVLSRIGFCGKLRSRLC